MEKAQISMEFLFSLGLIFLIFLFMLVIISEKQSDIRNSKVTLGKLSECQRIANIITSLASSNDGASIEIKTNYYINIAPSGAIFANNEDSSNNEVVCTYISNPLDLKLNGQIRLQKKDGAVSAF